MPRRLRECCPQLLVRPMSGGDLEEGQREHGEGGVPVPGPSGPPRLQAAAGTGIWAVHCGVAQSRLLSYPPAVADIANRHG